MKEYAEEISEYFLEVKNRLKGYGINLNEPAQTNQVEETIINVNNGLYRDALDGIPDSSDVWKIGKAIKETFYSCQSQINNHSMNYNQAFQYLVTESGFCL